MTARGDARKRKAEAGSARLRESIAELEHPSALTEAEWEAVNAAACGNCGERTAVLNLVARIKAEAVQAERERIAQGIEALVCPGSPPAPLAKYAYETGKEHAAEIARGEGR